MPNGLPDKSMANRGIPTGQTPDVNGTVLKIIGKFTPAPIAVCLIFADCDDYSFAPFLFWFDTELYSAEQPLPVQSFCQPSG